MTGLLYHYTRTATLPSILKTNQLWFTDHRFLNDREELKFAKKVVQKTLTSARLIEEGDCFLTKDNSEDAKSKVTYFLQNFLTRFVSTVFRIDDEHAPYVFCLSRARDSLSQWRAYGSGQLCLVFDQDCLSSDLGAELINVRYKADDSIDEDLLQEITSYVVQKFELFRSGGPVGELLVEAAEDFISFTRNKLIPISLKHNGFCQEEEARYSISSYQNGAFKNSEIFYSEDRFATPRLRATLARPATKSLRGVIFGPGVDKQRAVDLVKSLNRTHGSSLTIEFSSIPYRD